MDTLIADDLLLLLLDDEKGTVPVLWIDAQTPLAAAVLAELALDDAVALQPGSALTSAKLHVTGAAPTDPVLAHAYEVVAEKPRTPGSLIERTKKGLQKRLSVRLEAAGMLERREEKVLGLFPRTTWPAADLAHERAVRDRLADVLLRDAEPDARTAVLAGILGAIDRAHLAVGATGADAARAKKRATAISKGDWASAAVGQAVQVVLIAVVAPMITTTVITSS